MEIMHNSERSPLRGRKCHVHSMMLHVPALANEALAPNFSPDNTDKTSVDGIAQYVLYRFRYMLYHLR
jgi:hypothetical protein